MTTADLARQVGQLCLSLPASCGAWRYNSGPPLAAAASQSVVSNGQVAGFAVARMTRLVADHSATAGQSVDDTLFAAHVAHAYQLLTASSNLTGDRKTAWLAYLAASCDFLIGNGDTVWYANGNVRMAQAVLLAVTAKATGRPDLQAVSDGYLTWTINPPVPKWATVGLRMVGQDAGYLTEDGGFDADYATVQLSQAARLFVLTGDPLALWLTDLLFRALEPRIDFTKMTLDTSGGSRHPQSGRWIWFTSCALPVLAAHSRPDLAGWVDGWWASVLRPEVFPNGLNPPSWYAMGYDLGTALRAAR